MLKAEFWIFSTLFAVGVIFGLSYLLISPTPVALHVPSSPPRSSPIDEPGKISADSLRVLSDGESEIDDFDDQDAFDNPTMVASKLRSEGDAFLMAANFVSAATRYKKLQRLNGRFTSDVSIRLGICAEFDRQPGAAAAHYLRAIESQPLDHQRWLALSALSRTWIERGNRSEALHILCELFLESLGAVKMPEEIQAQIGFQLANVFQEIALQNYHYDLTLPDGITFQTVYPRLEELVALLNQLPTPTQTRTTDSDDLPPAQLKANPPTAVSPLVEAAPRITVVQRPTKAIELTIVDAQSSLQPLNVLTKHLATACELELFASPEAQLLITGRSKALNVKGIPASLLLDCLLLPLNLFWYQDEQGLHLVSLQEKDAHLETYWSGAMERKLRRFGATFPDDYRNESAILSRGCLKFIQGDLDQAANHFQELLQRNPTDELLAKLFFNIGKVEMRLGRNENAIRNFYHTLDQTYDTGFQSTAYWLVGQLSLEANQLSDAIKASGRAISTARIDQQKRLAALTMSRAYLLSNQPASANQVLFENQLSFRGTDLEATAAVLGSYARYLSVSDASSLNSESSRLLSAVAMAADQNYENFIDIYIAARAWQELGFREKAIEKLTLAADSTTISIWRRQILFELGVQLKLAGKEDQAISVFEFLLDDEPDQWQQKALLQLCQLFIQQKRTAECLAICERLLDDELNESDKKTTLNVMGRAYREMGEHHSAALCFAGMLPTTAIK